VTRASVEPATSVSVGRCSTKTACQPQQRGERENQ
jgi:hypothetical protein